MVAPEIQGSLSRTVFGDKLLNRIRLFPRPLLLGGIILCIYIIVALSGHYWAPYSHNQALTAPPFTSPSREHIFGTDQLGRDIFSRVILGTKEVMFLSLSSTFVALVFGCLIGLSSGFIGGSIDQIIMRLLEILISIPLLIFALLIVAAAGPELSGNRFLLIGTVATVYGPRIARMARAAAIEITVQDFITIARLRGESTWSVVWREIAPNATGVLLVEFGVRAGYAPILISTLSFLGFGVRPPTPEWGLMISESRSALVAMPIAVLAPAFVLAIYVISINLCTDGLARILGRSVQLGSD